MATVLTIGGSTVNVPKDVILDKLVPWVRGGIPTLSFQARGGALPTLPDPYLGKSITLAIGGTTYFSGRVISVDPPFESNIGWVRNYQSIGLRGLGDYVPLTDATYLIDSSPWNLRLEDPDYLAARAGRTVGQVITSVLTMTANANGLNSYGIGNYTGLPSAPVLPAATVTDLSTLTQIVPCGVYVQGERLLSAIEAFVIEWAPNHALHVDPTTGTLRFLDQRSFTNTVLTMGVDPIHPTPLSRSVADCRQRVVVRGQPIAMMFLFKTSQGTLIETFQHDSDNTNALAKAHWRTSDFTQTTHFQSTGTTTCPTTTTIVYTSTNAAETWASNALDQTATGRHATINLYDSAGAGINLMWTARVVANTALAAGGTSTLTIDAALPVLTYNKATLSWNVQGASIVWREYQIADSSLWPLVVSQATYPQPFISPGGAGVVDTSTPMGAVIYNSSNLSAGPPYAMFPAPFIYLGAGSGKVLFSSPTYITANNSPPVDVWVLLPINRGTLTVQSPPDLAGVAQYAGTSHSVEGLSDTLTVTVPEWRDPAQSSNMQTYSDSVLDSVKDAVVEGSVTYKGLYTPALTPGIALSIAASGFTAPYGWGTIAVPVVETELDFQPSGGTLHTTRMRVSSRRAHFSSAAFLHPARTGITWGPPEGLLQVNATSAFQSLAGGIAGILGPQGAAALGDEGISRLTSGLLANAGQQANLGAPEVGAGFGGGGDLGLPRGLSDFGIPRTVQDAGANPFGQGLGIPQSLQEANNGVDPFGGMNLQGPGNNLATPADLAAARLRAKFAEDAGQ